jgi:hypothetical protein
MTSTLNCQGRLCNHIIRNLAVSLIAEKYDLYVDYSYINSINALGITLYCGKNKYPEKITLNDRNYMTIYNSSTLCHNLNMNGDIYLQAKEIIHLIYQHLRKEEVMRNIIDINLYKDRYKNNNDIFVHIRLGDTRHLNPGLEYYKAVISNISFDHLYIATDDTNDSIINTLKGLYPNSTIVNTDEVNTIQFGSTCKNIVLSHGSFSSTIGYLSYYSTVYYPSYNRIERIWFGDLFEIDGWICI